MFEGNGLGGPYPNVYFVYGSDDAGVMWTFKTPNYPN